MLKQPLWLSKTSKNINRSNGPIFFIDWKDLESQNNSFSRRYYSEIFFSHRQKWSTLSSRDVLSKDNLKNLNSVCPIAETGDGIKAMDDATFAENLIKMITSRDKDLTIGLLVTIVKQGENMSWTKSYTSFVPLPS